MTTNINTHMSYYEKNKDKLLEKQKEYYKSHKDKIHEKITCECGSTFVKTQIKRHNDSKKHQNFLALASPKLIKNMIGEAKELYFKYYEPPSYENNVENK